ncbi:MAG TPA: TIGR04282 family arsenosugar biosynthesis glycosyltransferase [Thermoanaerobaculia bacterium]|nr:TIGR04282 family arsenosugar biosynthesis glycosyltransferase [Thermoanaerobaculia bacterium]
MPAFATTPPPPKRLLVFARLPEIGKVKTRLAQSIGEDKALAVYEAMLRDLLESIGAPTADTEIEVVWAPTPEANGATLRRAFGDRPLAMQTGSSLGDRLAMAFSERFFFARALKIVVIGVDDPSLPRELIDRAFSLLDACEWVIGPATDGGYYLLGARAASFESAVFAGVPWGTPSVLETTMEKIRSWGNTVAVLPVRSDIDAEADLRRFAKTGEAGGALRSLLQAWGWCE